VFEKLLQMAFCHFTAYEDEAHKAVIMKLDS
jgi:hypothetical protein